MDIKIVFVGGLGVIEVLNMNVFMMEKFNIDVFVMNFFLIEGFGVMVLLIVLF